MTATVTLSHTPQQIGGLKRSNAYKDLIAKGLTEKKALKRLGVCKVKPVTDNDTKVAALIATGEFTKAEAERVVAGQFYTATQTAQVDLTKKAKGKKAKAVVAEPEPVESKTAADALVAESGFQHGRGRVYVNAAIVEGIVRVLKTGTPEIIATSGVGRVPAVVLFREDSGDVAVHNLFRP